MSPIFTPLFVVFGMMLWGFITDRIKVLPAQTADVLNQYVYYIAFPAIMLIVLAETEFKDIMQWRFILGYSAAMGCVYLLSIFISYRTHPKRGDMAAIRGLNTTFGNTSFIGIPLMMMLYPDQQNALTAAAIASLLSVIMFAIVLVSIALHQGQTQRPTITALEALFKNPIIIGSAIGAAISALNITLPVAISQILTQIGMTSSPCALFAIGMVLSGAMRGGSKEKPVSTKSATIELSLINFAKLIMQPLLVYLFFVYLGVEPQMLVMGVLLAALPTAASVYLLAQRYDVQAGISAIAITLGVLLSFITLPIINHLLLMG
ncbi:AEC family transporter [Shewanella waksmanii]|uniref:AEC family transporter n=1 Tax=Shewanella waksmanii TaxID=213783 RepID=UPI003736EEF8